MSKCLQGLFCEGLAGTPLMYKYDWSGHTAIYVVWLSYIYIYINMYVCMYVYIYIFFFSAYTYIYIYVKAEM